MKKTKKSKRLKKSKFKSPEVRQHEKMKALKDWKAPTGNARLIREYMIARNVKGDFKDYVIMTGNHLVDWLGSYDIGTPEGEKVGIVATALIHKRNLRNVIGEENAKRFWHPSYGRVGIVKPDTTIREK